jgi:cellulose synthase/poly-beta-1,6-N-acetylglucosamine synthase-like glycosyltransferase
VSVVEYLLVFYLSFYGTYWLLIAAAALLPELPQVLYVDQREITCPRLVGLVIPVFNETAHLALIEQTLAEARRVSVRSVVVDDGSTDGSTLRLQDICRRLDAIFICHSYNQGKAVALNTGIAEIDTEWILTLDADTVINFHQLLAVEGCFSKKQVGAVALTIAVTAGPPLVQFQSTEYHYVLNTERAALARFGLVFTVPGAAALWRRAALSTIGGFSTRTCAEDTDATISLQLAEWGILVFNGMTAVTEGPSSLSHLLRQRARWIWGTIQAATYTSMSIFSRPLRRGGVCALAFVLVTTTNGIGFIAVTAITYRFFAGIITTFDVIAALLLLVSTLFRIFLTHRLLGPLDQPVPTSISHLLIMQIVNTAGFWLGIICGRVVRRSWL